MLNREVCKRCVNTISDTSVDTHFAYWDNHDEENWADGEILCPGSLIQYDDVGIGDTSESPPRWCPHIFEHAVAEGISDVE